MKFFTTIIMAIGLFLAAHAQQVVFSTKGQPVTASAFVQTNDLLAVTLPDTKGFTLHYLAYVTINDQMEHLLFICQKTGNSLILTSIDVNEHLPYRFTSGSKIVVTPFREDVLPLDRFNFDRKALCERCKPGGLSTTMLP